MSGNSEPPGDGRLLQSGDEAGTAPGDRRFRPDIEGLRAVAIVLVVLYHAGLRGLSGGYIGVDVFFVISGFVITGVLLREQAATHRTSILAFYGRRCRRIIPAATLAIVVTVVATYAVLGVVDGNQTAIDARWAAIFLANFHFASVGTNYLSAQLPPSPLQNFWSLAVEEQFYLVYPTIFLVLSAVRSRLSLRARLAIGLTATIVASFTFSVIQTASNPTVAFFSPFTRAWELALGALIAVGTEWLLEVPEVIGSIMTWAGLGAIGLAAVMFTSNTPYPGWQAALPVIGTALVIAGGAATPRWAAEGLLKVTPFRWLGKLSYSLYLWHWPILIIAAESVGKTSLPFSQNLVWLLVALLASIVSYNLVENPIRHSTFVGARRWAPIGLGVALIAVSFGVATVGLGDHASTASTPRGTVHPGRVHPTTSGTPDPSTFVANLVRVAPLIRVLPADLTPSLAGVRTDWGGPGPLCWPALGQTSIPACVFGDPHGTRTMVLYGDSHAAMWFDAVNVIAVMSHWKLVYLGKGDCPADMLTYENPPGWGRAGGEYSVCDQWHRFALDRISRLHPDLVVITQEVRGKPDGKGYSAHQWQQGLETTFDRLGVAKSKIVVLGNIPILPQAGPQCLARNSAAVQKCSGPVVQYSTVFNRAERAATASKGARYIDVTPWFCSTICTAIIGKYQVYWDDYHIAATYSFVLEGVLTQSLGLSTA